VEARVEYDDFEDNENANGDQAERSDLSQDLLQVAGGVIVLTNEGGSTTEESVGTGGDDDTLSLTLLASRTPMYGQIGSVRVDQI
jgi:hypothetical protein